MYLRKKLLLNLILFMKEKPCICDRNELFQCIALSSLFHEKTKPVHEICHLALCTCNEKIMRKTDSSLSYSLCNLTK